MADDDDTIFVDIAARLDEKSAEQATSKLRDKFKRTKVPVEPDLDESATDKTVGRLRDRLKGAGKAVGDSISDALGDSHLDDAADKAAKKLGNRFKGLGDQLGKSLGEELGHVLGTSDGDIGSSLGKVFKDRFGGLNDILNGKGSDDILGSFDVFKGTIRDAAEGLRQIAPEGSRAAKSLGAVADAAGPLAALLAAATFAANDQDKHRKEHGEEPYSDMGTWDQIKQHMYDEFNFSDLSVGGVHGPNIPSWFGINDPSKHPKSPGGWWGGPSHSPGNFLPSLPGAITKGAPGTSPGPGGMPGLPSFAPPDTGGFHTSGFASGSPIHATLADYTHPDTPDISDPSDIPGAAGGVANLYRVAQALQGTPYSQQVRNDCSGMVSKLANAALGLPPTASFSTQNEGQWLAGHGFRPGMGGPGDLSIGWYNHGPNPNDGHTAATLPGGVNAESGGSHGAFALGAGAAGAASPQFDQHMYLPMGAGGGGVSPAGYGSGGSPGGGGSPLPGGGGGGGFGLPGMPFAGGVGPGGAGAGPGGVGVGGSSAPRPPGVSQQNVYGQKTAPALGTGQGFGLTGSGLIGLAESLPGQMGMAAASGASGGPAPAGIAAGAGAAIAQQVWANIGQPEMNQAIQTGVQAAATTAMAPMEETWLGGGMMGAPSVGSPASAGWTGKMLSSLVGQGTNLANLAGSVQPPQQPDDDNKPSTGASDFGGGPQGGKGQGPSGTPDDPMHVNVTNQPPPPAQGSQTSKAAVTSAAASPAMI